ncbi:MAG: crossover junction endodeoxyribonuclease RuvC [bacterium]
MKVIGIDPGSNVTGYGILERDERQIRHVDSGIIAPRAGMLLPERLSLIYREISSLIERHEPEILAIEDLFVAKNARSSLILGHARGVAILAACLAGLPVSEYAPSQVKQAVVGTGRADKYQVQLMVKAILRLPEVACEDASDALAVAICHLNSSVLAGMIDRKQKSGGTR